MKIKNNRCATALFLCVVFSFAPAASPMALAQNAGIGRVPDKTFLGVTGKSWREDYDLMRGRCNTAEISAALRKSERAPDSREVAIISGTSLGLMVKAKTGASVENIDLACIGHTLELLNTGKTVGWTNQSTSVGYRLTLTRSYMLHDISCRTYVVRVSTDKKTETLNASACRHGDGLWAMSS